MIFIDSNVPMYLIGADHPLKERSRRLTEDVVAANETLCTSAEVLQEILHRYRAVGRDEDTDAAFQALLGLTEIVYAIELADVERARRLLRTAPDLSARDAIHVAVMQAHDIGSIMSFDRGFDGIAGITRLA